MPVVAGGKSGIGIATAKLFAVEGATVVIADLRDASEETSVIDGGWTAQ